MLRLLLVCVFTVGAISCDAQDTPSSFHDATADSPRPGTLFVHPERILLKEGGFFTAYRGQAFVPLNRSHGGSDVISIEFYRFPRSENADPNTPPLFLLNGGPGFKGLATDLARPGTFENRIKSFLDMTEVVVVGQRGIGSSKPDTVIRQSAVPSSDDADELARFQGEMKKERDYWLGQGVDLSGFNVLEAATDVHDIAKGLGFDKIILSGGSFGSHWGMAIMRKHPNLVERAILHGMEGPDHTWDHPGWIWNVYKRVAEDAESSDRLKECIPEQGLIHAVETMLKNAEANPVVVTLNKGNSSERTVEIDSAAMRSLARGYKNSLRSWPADIIEMSRGNFENAARRVMTRSRIRPSGLTTASFWMLDSGSGITARRRAVFESDPAMKIIGSTFDYYAKGSPVWETDLGDDFRQNFETGIPTVIVHGTWDTSTPYENAVELAPFFKNSKFITVKRGSHGAFSEAMNADKNFRNAIRKFTVSGDMSGLPDQIELPLPRWSQPGLRNR